MRWMCDRKDERPSRRNEGCLKDVFDPYDPKTDGAFEEITTATGEVVFSHRSIEGKRCVRTKKSETNRCSLGCYLWRSALTPKQQLELFHACWFDFPQPPASTNLVAHYGTLFNLAHSAIEGRYLKSHVDATDERWSMSAEAGPSAASLFKKLRWCSLGPHYNWTSRRYEIDVHHRSLPDALVDIWRRFLASTCRLEGVSVPDWKPDAALINYYAEGDSLGGHKDDAEEDMTKPIVSLSLGSTGVFLLGGETRAEAPTPVLLRSGDVVVLHHQARRCYHGVPCVIHKENVCYQESLRHGYVHCSDMKCKALNRISISIRSLR